MFPQLPDGKVELAVDDVALGRRRAPDRVVCAFVRLQNDLDALVDELLLFRFQPADEVCVDGSWVDGGEGDGRVATGQLGGVDDVGKLALAIARPLGAGPEILGRLETVEHNAARKRVHKAERCEEQDAGVAGRLRGLLNRGEQELDEEGVRDMIDGELILVAVFGQGRICGHDAGV